MWLTESSIGIDCLKATTVEQTKLILSRVRNRAVKGKHGMWTKARNTYLL